ncbi:MAG: tail fiber domain-containing protein [Lysobacterales bacterium]
MKRLTLYVALAATLGMGASLAQADSFTYHGSLQDAGKAANGSYDLQLTLYSAQSGGHVLAGPVTLYGVRVTKGNFVTNVDFGAMTALTSQGWVDVKVKPANAGDFTALDSRSPVAAPDSACPGSWALDGNAGNPVGSYVGTADAQPLIFETNATSAGAFYPDAPNNAIFYTYGKTSLAFSDGADGLDSLAAGFRGHAVNEGSFDWSPANGTIVSVPDTANEQFIVNAPHGVGINTATAPDGTPLRDELTIAVSPDLPASNADLTFETGTGAGPAYNGFNFNAQPFGYFQLTGLYNNSGLAYDSLMYIDYRHPNGSHWGFNGAGSVSGNAFTVGVDATGGNGASLSSGGVWTNASSRTFKEAFAAIDPVNVLQKLVAMPVQTWFYKGNHDDGQHMGPVAEDFASTFGLGHNEKYIGTVDESGVALAAIQGLNRKVEAENATLKQENADLRGKLDAVAARLDKLESQKGE